MPFNVLKVLGSYRSTGLSSNSTNINSKALYVEYILQT